MNQLKLVTPDDYLSYAAKALKQNVELKGSMYNKKSFVINGKNKKFQSNGDYYTEFQSAVDFESGRQYFYRHEYLIDLEGNKIDYCELETKMTLSENEYLAITNIHFYDYDGYAKVKNQDVKLYTYTSLYDSFYFTNSDTYTKDTYQFIAEEYIRKCVFDCGSLNSTSNVHIYANDNATRIALKNDTALCYYEGYFLKYYSNETGNNSIECELLLLDNQQLSFELDTTGYNLYTSDSSKCILPFGFSAYNHISLDWSLLFEQAVLPHVEVEK